MLRIYILALAILALPTLSTSAAEDRRPNVVFIMLDDLGATDLGCTGSKYYQTPHIDRLAAEGMRFTQAYSACPVCSPTRAALLTGLYPARLHLTDFIPGEVDHRKHKLLRPEFHQELPLETVTLAERLKGAGYVTAAIGKWHLGASGFEPERHGFEIAMGGFERGSVASHFAPYLKDGRQLPGLENPPDGEYITERLTTEAERFLEQQSAERPFFLYLSHYAVHTPIQAQPDAIARYQAIRPPGLQRNPVFAGLVDAMDQSVGRVLAKLAELHLAENTLVIFTSDNGGLATSGQPTNLPATNNAPFREGKGYLYEGGIRVPLIVRWPGHTAAGTTCDTPTITMDLAATICAACQVPVNEALDGQSMVDLLDGKTIPPRDALYWHYPHYSPQGGRAGGAIRDGDYKLIEYYESGRRELFNLASDVSESHNLIDREAQVAERLAAKFAGWLKQVDARMPTPNPGFVPDEQADDGSITLAAETADVQGVMLRYEPLPHKNTLGFWTRQDDWASWEFVVVKGGTFEVELVQGCGPGSGGSEVDVEVAGQILSLTVAETGGFQKFVPRVIGSVAIDKPGRYTLTVKPRTKPGVAVMDLRAVRLLPRAAK